MRFLRVAVVLAAVGLVSIASAAWIDSSLQNVDEPRIDERVRAAKAAGDGIAVWFETAKAEVEAMARILEPWSGTPGQSAAVRPTLDDLVSATSVFDDGAIVLSVQSRVIATSGAKAPLLQLERDSPHAQLALRGTTAVSGVVEDPLERVPVVAFATPLRDLTSRVTGALVATSRVDDSVSRMIKRYQTDPSILGAGGVRVLLVAPDGASLVPDEPEPLQLDLLDARAPAIQARADSAPGFFEYLGESGVAKVAGYAKASDGWVVVLPQDARDFYSFGTDFLGRLSSATPTRTAAIGIALILVIASAAMTWLYRRLVSASLRAEEAKRAFLAITGHELRTPLTSIRGFSQMLTTRWEGIPEENRKELIQTIARQARNLEHLVERLIVGAQLEAGIGPSPTIRPYDAALAIDQAADQYGAMSTLHSIEVDVERPLMVEADAKMLQEVVGHLLENALKYSPAGGSVWVKGRREGSRVRITVEDEGVGLPSDISGIFEKFIQGEAVDTRTHDEGGVGLGLFIVKTFLDRMHGSVAAFRREPSGARFVVTVKAAPK